MKNKSTPSEIDKIIEEFLSENTVKNKPKGTTNSMEDRIKRFNKIFFHDPNV